MLGRGHWLHSTVLANMVHLVSGVEYSWRCVRSGESRGLPAGSTLCSAALLMALDPNAPFRRRGQLE